MHEVKRKIKITLEYEDIESPDSQEFKRTAIAELSVDATWPQVLRDFFLMLGIVGYEMPHPEDMVSAIEDLWEKQNGH